MNERIRLPIAIHIDDLPENVAKRLRGGDVVAELHVTATGFVQCYAVVDLPPVEPNDTTIAAIEAADRGEFIGEYGSVDELFKALNADD